MKTKLIIIVVMATLIWFAKFMAYDYRFSDGRRVGNLTKISKKGKIIKTWEGTVDEGSGDKLTSKFSVRDDEVGKQLFAYEGKEVVIYYHQSFLSWPWETNYNVVHWRPRNPEVVIKREAGQPAGESPQISLVRELEKTLFCSALGAIYTDQDLYQEVKEHLKSQNLWIYQQIERCNKPSK